MSRAAVPDVVAAASARPGSACLQATRAAVSLAAVTVLVGLLAAPSAPASAAGGFVDVPPGHTFETPIMWLHQARITFGCNPPANDRFCPDDLVTRGQVAAFVARALELTGWARSDRFVDDDGSVFEGDIERLAAAGITRGCNPPANDRFCPHRTLTRGEMAALVVRALQLTDGARSDRFVDDDGSVFEGDIERLAAAGITLGCNPPANDRFCPEASVTRGQMAAFLWRAAGSPFLASGDVLAAAGDIARCDLDSDEMTAVLLDGVFDSAEGIVATLGDNAYNSGTPAEFADCYNPTWGRHLDRTMPSPGNHDYLTPGASGYFSYFGARAGSPSSGYYVFSLGRWQVIALNSNCAEVGGCEAGSRQETWLRRVLAADPARCTAAYFHHPRFSSGFHGPTPALDDLWTALHDHGADVVLNGHEHNYERLAPMESDGARDEATGIRTFIVGTGGTSLRGVLSPGPNSESVVVRHGILVMELSAGGYSWEFLDVDGAIADAGSASCH